MERGRQILLFEPEEIPQAKRAEFLRSLFYSHSEQKQFNPPSAQYAPVDVLETHGELDSCLRHLIKAAEHTHRTSPPAIRALRSIEKLLDALPESIMSSLYAEPRENWIACYKNMARIHELMDEANLVEDAQEYANIVEQMARLAQAVNSASRVQINAASAFALMLLHARTRPVRKTKRARRRKKTKNSTTKKKRVTAKRKNTEGKDSV